MKKLTVLFAVLLCFAVIISACNNNVNNDLQQDSGNDVNTEVNEVSDNTENTTPVAPKIVNAASLKGPTSMGLVKVMEDSGNVGASEYVFDFTIEAAADAIAPRIIKGEIDIAAVPANLASVLYNKTNGNIVVLDINTLGVMYVVENGNTVKKAEDLRGKTIYCSGKGNTPEYALNYMLEANGLVPGKDVMVEFKAEHAECVAAILAEPSAVAMLPQPFATTAQMQNEGIRIALDINKVWESASGKTLVTGVTVARKDFAEANKEAVAEFMKQHKESAAFVNANVDEAAALIEKFDIFKAAVAKRAIPLCSISYIDGEEMKTKLRDYLDILYAQNPSAVGGKLPGDDFYYIAQ